MDKDRIGGVRAARACESMLICSRRPPHVKLATTDGYGGSNTGRKKKGDASIVMRFAWEFWDRGRPSWRVLSSSRNPFAMGIMHACCSPSRAAGRPLRSAVVVAPPPLPSFPSCRGVRVHRRSAANQTGRRLFTLDTCTRKPPPAYRLRRGDGLPFNIAASAPESSVRSSRKALLRAKFPTAHDDPHLLPILPFLSTRIIAELVSNLGASQHARTKQHTVHAT
jgi:hypothetical protein